MPSSMQAAETPLQTMVRNSQLLRGRYIWQGMIVKRLVAYLYTMQDKELDLDGLQAAYDLVKSKVGSFSMLRGSTALALAAKLSLSAQPRALLDKTVSAYRHLKEAGFWSSEYLAWAACEVAQAHDETSIIDAAQKAKAVYRALKELHPFLTGQDDCLLSIHLSQMNQPAQDIAARVDGFYQQLKGVYPLLPGGAYRLCQVLALMQMDEASARAVPPLVENLAQLGLNIRRAHTLPLAGILLAVPKQEELAAAILSVRSFLRQQPGFSRWSVYEEELLLFAAGLTLPHQAPLGAAKAADPAILSSLIDLLIAQHAVYVAVAASAGT